MRPFGLPLGPVGSRALQCASSACLENGEFDDDCCGAPAATGCAEGFAQSTVANGCRGVGTCCSSQAEALHPVRGLGLIHSERVDRLARCVGSCRP